MTKILASRKRIHLLAVGLYSALALVLTWPLVCHLSTHVPGSYTWAFDEYTFLWNMWWFRYALLDLGQNPFYSTHTFFPLGISLILYTFNLFNDLISLPLQPFLSLPAISNLIFLFATTLSSYGTFLLAEYLLRGLDSTDSRPATAGRTAAASTTRTAAAFLAGLIYAFGSYRMVYAAIGHYNLWSTAWIPFYTLFLVKTIREPGRRNAALAGLFLVLTLLCETFLGVFVGILTLILLAYAAGRQGRRQVAGGLPALLGRLVVLGLVAAILFAPLLIPILSEMSGGYELAGWGDAEKLSVDLVGLVTPTALHPLGGGWTETLRQTREGTARFQDLNTVFLGWAGLALAIVGAIRYWRQLKAWIGSFFILVLFSLGPLLQVNGRSQFHLDGLDINIPLPFILLHYIPIVRANRVPNRFSVVLMLSLAVMAAFGAYWLLRRLSHSRRQALRLLFVPCAALLAGLLLFDHWSVPLPLTDARIPPLYDQIASEPGDFSILQLPLGWRNSFGMQGAESTQVQYYQAAHHKRLLSGNTSRNPPVKFDYFRQIPILDSLITLETYGQVDATRRAADQAGAAEFVSFYDLRYVVVAPGTAGRPPYVDTRDAAVAYIEEVLPLEKLADQDGWLLYSVERSLQPSQMILDFGSEGPLAAMVIGEGWAPAETIQGVAARWAIGQGAQVFLTSAARSDCTLTLNALPFDYPGAKPQTLTPQINGRELEPVILSSGWQAYTWDIPGQFLQPGLNEMRLQFGRLDAPAQVVTGQGDVGTTGIQSPLTIEVNSGGPDDFAYITLWEGDRAKDGSIHSPGYNVAIVHPRSGKLLARHGFDTTPSGTQSESDSLARLIASVPAGQIVVVAMQGDGAALLTDRAVAALRSIGGQADPRQGTGWSHAIIGVKGAAPGTALEAVGVGEGWLRVSPDRRTLAVAVGSLEWNQKNR